jgi:glutathione S-transferase
MFKTVSSRAQIRIKNDIKSGLHLFHFDFSNCSQRVRICLIEKGVEWNSHPVNLLLNEHSTDWFQSINPKGLVPVLVHNGSVVTESVEIIRYIDRMYPSPCLQPEGISNNSVMDEIISLADSVQSQIKLLTHYFLEKPQRLLVKISLEKFSDNHNNSDLVAFKKRFANNEFTVDEVRKSIDEMHKVIRIIDTYLIKQTWFLGDDFSLADIAWMVNIHRLDLMGFPLSRYRNLGLWYQQCKQRESFQQGLVDFEPALIMFLFKINKYTNRSKHKKIFGFE